MLSWEINKINVGGSKISVSNRALIGKKRWTHLRYKEFRKLSWICQQKSRKSWGGRILDPNGNPCDLIVALGKTIFLRTWHIHGLQETNT